MIRGINKRIIEVNDTGSELFEKALLFVKNDSCTDEEHLKKEAERVVAAYMTDDGNTYKPGYLRYTEKKRKSKRSKIIISCCAALVIVAVCSVLLYVL